MRSPADEQKPHNSMQPADDRQPVEGGLSAEATDEIARSRVVLTTAVDSIITIDSHGIISFMNPATVRMFGYSQRELIGRNISILMPPPYRDEHDDYLKRFLETGHASVIGIGRRVTGRRKDGNNFPIHLAVSEFQENGQRHFTGIVRDLTELERVQNQLLQSERLAAIGQMMTGLAHESRNALQRAQACLDMLSLDLEDDSDQLSLAKRAMMALHDLSRLYEEVRNYAAPIHLEYRECDLSAIWRKEWDNLAPARAEKRLRLKERFLCDSVRCEVDVHRLEQVFRNILENAVHASPGRGEMTVECRDDLLNRQPAIQVIFRDQGPGLSPSSIQQIFEPFFTTKQKGTGLGMAIARRIVLTHRGTIAANCSPAGGAEIVVTLPIKADSRNVIRI